VRAVTGLPGGFVYTARVKLVGLLTLTATATAGFLLAVFTTPACTSTCAQNCPAATVYIVSANDGELNGILGDIEVDGPACPSRSTAICLGDAKTSCSHASITGQRAGGCDVAFVFGDRPTEILHLQFGEPMNANGSCCKGYPVIGPALYTIPVKPTGPIYSGTPGTDTYSTDAVTVLVDGGAPDASHADGGQADAGDAGQADAGQADAGQADAGDAGL
jgi:hypothetical protein